MAINFTQQVRAATSRWLYSVNFNAASDTYGVADREYWTGNKDFANGLGQAGLAGFIAAAPLLDLDPPFIQKVYSAVLEGTKKIQRSNGGFDCKYPYEQSFDVTAQVVFYLLVAEYLLDREMEKQRSPVLSNILEKAFNFLRKNRPLAKPFARLEVLA